jgi:hypothetical protein
MDGVIGFKDVVVSPAQEFFEKKLKDAGQNTD